MLPDTRPPRFTPPAKRYAGYIFDCDGTLVESMPLHHRAWQTAFAQHRAPFDFDWALFVRRAGMPLVETVVELNREFGCALDAVVVAEDQRRAFRALLSEMEPIVPVVEFARTLHQTAPLGVASGAHYDQVEHALRAIGLFELFASIVTTERVSRGKPDPEGFLLCARELGVAPSECLVIEDGEFGIEAARRAGMDCVRVGPAA